MTDVFDFLFSLTGGDVGAQWLMTFFVGVLVLIAFNTLITFLFAIVSSFFRR